MNAVHNEQVSQSKKSGFFAALLEYLDVRILEPKGVKDDDFLGGPYHCGGFISLSEFASNDD